MHSYSFVNRYKPGWERGSKDDDNTSVNKQHAFAHLFNKTIAVPQRGMSVEEIIELQRQNARKFCESLGQKSTG